ncbi:MAG: bifunctional (p)ppGpp synthetase/guanosine-3',5'-bis(diphosphate) 3'-pyrophosphohydrolase [Candidatus Sumerlaeia bacterium]
MPVAEDRLSDILGAHRVNFSESQRALILRALEFGEQAHAGQKRLTGEPYFTHCLEVARILAGLRMDHDTIAAGLLHDVMEDTRVGFEQLRQEFGPVIAALVEGVTKLSAIQFPSRRALDVENLRKIILAMAQDVRVVIIKLADRLHNMRTLGALPPDRQVKIARDTLEIFAPLANRLGIHLIKAELEDAAMAVLYPEAYAELRSKVAAKRAERQAYVNELIAYLQGELARHDIPAEVRGRPKHFWSIYSKMQDQGLSFEQIYDLIGVRIITDTRENCYKVLAIVHDLFKPIEGRFKDYISLPKENLYRSIHTTVIGLKGRVTEVQIRTREMDEEAELGIAAHWKYKEGITRKTPLDQSLRRLREAVESIRDERDPEQFLETLKQDLLSDAVYCFTPRGDVVELPRGATPIDFAYSIHTDIGHHCLAARVDGRQVSLKTELRNGQMVEIITAKSARPSTGWLKIVKTARARNKIRHFLKSEHFEHYRDLGKNMILQQLSRRHAISWKDVEEDLTLLAKRGNHASRDDLLIEVGFGTVKAAAVAAELWRLFEARREDKRPGAAVPPPLPPPRPSKRSRRIERRSEVPVIIEGGNDYQFTFAQCCNPLPGQEITGFITRGRGVSIHRKGCRNLQRTLDGNLESAARLVRVHWNRQAKPIRPASFRVVAYDRVGLLHEITEIISQRGINLAGVRSGSAEHNNQAVIQLDLDVTNYAELHDVLNEIRNVAGVVTLEPCRRSGGR